MRNGFLFLWLPILILSSTAFASSPARFINRIEGAVYSPERRPLENVNIELRSESEMTVSQTRTNSAGRFTFAGMPSGRFTLRALPLNSLNFAEQSQEVFITNIGISRTDIAYVDFYLAYNKRQDSEVYERSAEAIFVQEVPPAAKKLYEDGAKDLSKNPASGFAKLNDALKIFPDYFDALTLLGRAYLFRKEYDKSYPYLLRAIDINPRSYNSFFRLGYIFYQMKQYAAALKGAQAAITLSPDSVDAQLLYGTILRVDGQTAEAEKTLLKANKLAKEKNAEVHWQLALLYNRLKRNKEAVAQLETYLKLAPDSPEKPKIQDLIAKLKTSNDAIIK